MCGKRYLKGVLAVTVIFKTFKVLKISKGPPPETRDVALERVIRGASEFKVLNLI